METLIKPTASVIYEGKDITADVFKYMLSLTYTDKVEGESDELEIQLEDAEGLWNGPWYPTKGDTLKVSLGYENTALVDCGTFEIDEIECSGPPDTVSIRGLAAGIKKAVRSKNSKAYENQTLKQIAQAIASKHGFSVTGTIENIKFTRVTQNAEHDLSFLRRLSEEFGHTFSVREKQLVFTLMYDLEKGKTVVAIDRTDLMSYSIKDKTSQSYRTAVVKYHNPTNKQVVEYKTSGHENAGGSYEPETAEDELIIHTKAENLAQAQAKAKAALWRANSKQQEGSLTVPGTTLLLAGNNIELTGMGPLSGKYHIKESRHTLDRGSGYVTDIAVKRVGFVDKEKEKSTKGQDTNTNYRVIS
jgi:phage protein D